MRKIKKSSIKVLLKFALPADELKKLKGGDDVKYDQHGNIIIEDIVNG